MNKSARSRSLFFSAFSFWVAFVVIGLYFVLPFRQRIKFGIDLVGGTYITLSVQVDKAIEAELITVMQRITERLKKNKHERPQQSVVENGEIILTFSAPLAAQEAAEMIKTTFINARQRTGLELVQGMETELRLKFNEHKEEQIKREAVSSNINVLRTRLDKMSVAEISIAAQGDKNIIVELPDVADPMQAKAMIGKAAKLEFKLVEKEGRSKEDILYELDGHLPRDKEILPHRNGETFFLVSKYADVTGAYLKDAQADIKRDAGLVPVVNFSFSPEGGEKFYKLTSKNFGRRLAVVLDDVVITAPSIKTGIRDRGYIEGVGSTQEARELALLLKSGAFVAPVTFEEQRQIGATLGEESIRKGVISCLVGLALLFFFSLVYYKVSGLLAFIALVYNLILILLGLAWLRATLTLPGIAGMVLTIGMAIDASILIYERIRLELAEGLTTKKAVNLGFSNAMKVILDANITTFIVGVVLYKFGTGPIQGFAVTMMLGIISTLITGLFFLKALFNFVLDLFNIQKLGI